MTAIPMLDEEDCYLAAILDDPSGIELAEFCWIDEEQPDGCYRVWDFQWSWYRNEDTYQIDWAGRSLGKSVGIQMRAFAFPFNFPGQEMLVTAPELNHLRPVTDKIEHLILSHRLTRELLPRQRGNGINHQPQFQVHFTNNSRIISRLPQRDGKGVKGSCTAGTLVLTMTGHVPVEDVKVGDWVLTDRGRFRPVLDKYAYEAEVLTVAGAGHRGLGVSENHRFKARRNATPRKARDLGPSSWAIAESEELNRWYWASPTTFPDLPLPATPDGITDGVALLSLAGSYVADGCQLGTNKRGERTGVLFSDEEADIVRIEKVAHGLGYRTRRRASDTCPNMAIDSTSLAHWLDEHFGHRAEGKRLPLWLLSAPWAARATFLDGYLSGDGYWSEKKQRWEASTASKELAIGLKLLAQSLGLSTAYSWVDPKVTEICGVPLRKEPRRAHRIQINSHGHGHGIFEDNMLWGKIRSAKPAGRQMVYDLVVAEDHTYVGDGIVHLGSAFLPNGQEA